MIKTSKHKRKLNLKLIESVKRGDLNQLRHRLSLEVDVNVKDRNGKTPLHYAVSKDDTEIVKLLLEHGAHVDIKDKNNRTPLYYASCNHSEVMELLFEAGASVRLGNSFIFNLNIKRLIADSRLKPTEMNGEKISRLQAVNNKYPEEAIDPKKCGKWMLFPSENTVNSVWDKIKNAIQEGDLWKASVSTKDPKNPYRDPATVGYAIMIFTKDYTDIRDVINILNYLETSGIKSANTVIKYKTNEQTKAGIYAAGDKGKPSIYSSDIIHRSHDSCWRSNIHPNETSGLAQPARRHRFNPPTRSDRSLWWRSNIHPNEHSESTHQSMMVPIHR